MSLRGLRLLCGALCTGLLIACGGGGGGGGGTPEADAGLLSFGPPIAESVSFIDVTLPLSPADPAARYASKLSQCVWASPRSAPCTFTLLPTLYQEAGGTPTVDQIMGRVAVSDPWHAQRFRELLLLMPDDVRRLFRPVTAIIISNDVRPSFYWVYTGAIHLDPAKLWQTPGERLSLDDTPDFRSSFGADLQFTMPWRYVKDDAYAYRTNPPNGESRTTTEVLYQLTDLLFHELAHANDFTQPVLLPTIGQYDSIYDAFLNAPQVRVGDALDVFWSLTSSTMFDLARVRFYGDPSTLFQRGLTPTDVAGHFAPDVASDHYGYSSTAEDVAMLFEELLMDYHFGVERDVAVTNLPVIANPTSADYFVAWGQRGRVRDLAVNDRARYVAALLLPESSAALDAWSATLPGPQPMIVGVSWIDNLDLDTPIIVGSAKHRAAIAEPVAVAPDLE